VTLDNFQEHWQLIRSAILATGELLDLVA